MHARFWRFARFILVSLTASWALASSASKKTFPACRVATIEGELESGKPFRRAFGNGLEIWFQPITSGWILRVVPAAGPVGSYDYAELATPPYRSVTPLSLTTDFAFRAQDAVGWNPRRFRFATSTGAFTRLFDVYQRYTEAGATPPALFEMELAGQIADASEGTLTIEDARLIPGMADQWRMAGAVASHFLTTAHTLVNAPDGTSNPLGKLVWVRFRLDLQLPRGFKPVVGLKVVPEVCGVR